MFNKLFYMPILLFILFSTLTPVIADTGYSGIANYTDVEPSDFSFSITRDWEHTKKNIQNEII